MSGGVSGGVSGWRTAVNAAHTLTFYMYFFVGGVLFNLLVALPMWLLIRVFPGTRRILPWIARQFFRGLFVALRGVGALRFEEIDGLDVIRKAPSAVYVANHRSLLDVLLLLSLVPQATCLLKSVDPPKGARAEKRSFMPQFWQPFVAVAVDLVGYIPLPREWTHEALLDTFREGVDALQSGRPLIIFPEGTRSETGRLLPFHDFPFKLAIDAGVPVVPVAIHTHIPCMPRSTNSFLGATERARLRVKFCKPLNPRPRESAADLSYSARRVLQRTVSRWDAAVAADDQVPGSAPSQSR